MNKKIDVSVHSEIGELQGVILHTPGPETENMNPKNAEKALYSDILNLAVGSKEYAQLSGVLNKITRTFQVKDLLTDIAGIDRVKKSLVESICINENVPDIKDVLMEMSPKELADSLIEGVVLDRDNLTKFLSRERYVLRPLHNFFFTRDASITMYNEVLIARMASKVRRRESFIMESIFNFHPNFNSKTVNPLRLAKSSENIMIEGGDLLVVRDDILVIGIGTRTSTQGIDFIIEQLCNKKNRQHIIVQELPETPESFIHLDMVFTLLDRDMCMMYEPVILQPNRFKTVHIVLDNGKVSSITEEKNIPDVLSRLGMPLKAAYCGGKKDRWIQEREQWHSGANFFALAPGKVIGYGRNVHTIEELDKNGFEVIKASKVIKEGIDIKKLKKCVVTIQGDELSRGGGGCRCMTMPVKRKAL